MRGALARANPSVYPYFGLTRLRWALAARLIGALTLGFVGSLVFIWAIPRANPIHLTILLAVPFVFAVAVDHLVERCARLAEMRTRELDHQEIGAVPEDALYVGIAYADGFWSIQSSYSWDRGWLSISPNGLTFNGCASAFSLPSHAITGIRLARSSHESAARLRVFIDWLAPDGDTSALSLEPLIVGPRKAKSEAAESLHLNLQTTFSRPAEEPLIPTWPPSVSPERLRANDLRLGKRELIGLISRSMGTTLGACAVLYLTLTAFPVAPGFRRLLIANAFHFIFLGLTMLLFFFAPSPLANHASSARRNVAGSPRSVGMPTPASVQAQVHLPPMRRSLLLALPFLLLAGCGGSSSSSHSETPNFTYSAGLTSQGTNLKQLNGGTKVTGTNRLTGTTTIDGSPANVEMLGNVAYTNGNGPFFGFLDITLENGSILSMRMDGTATKNAAGVTSFDAKLEVIGGTETYNGATGQGHFTGTRPAELGSPLQMEVQATVR